MFSYADETGRAAFITGLRALADYLDAHSAIPVPPHGTDILLHVSAAEEGGRIQVRQLARQLGATVTDETPYGGHCHAARSFGPVSYRVLSIPNTCMAASKALWSYHGCVQPDATQRAEAARAEAERRELEEEEEDPRDPWMVCPSCSSTQNIREIGDLTFECGDCGAVSSA